MCGLFGVIKVGKPNDDLVGKMVKALAKASEDRGTDAGGVSFYNSEDKLTLSRRHGAISKSGVLTKDEIYSSSIIMGHTRASTQGVATFNKNNHPFPSTKGTYAFAHNGILYNDDHLASAHKLPKTKVITDSYVVVRMLDHLHNGVLNKENLIDVVERIGGMYNFTFLDINKNLWLVKNNNPLTIYRLNELGMIIYASTEDIIYEALDDVFGNNLLGHLMTRTSKMQFAKEIDINKGDILKFDVDGIFERFTYEPEKNVEYGVSSRQSFRDYSKPYKYHGSYQEYVYDNQYQKEVDDWYKYHEQEEMKRLEELDQWDDMGLGASVQDDFFNYYANLDEFISWRSHNTNVVFYNGSEEEVSHTIDRNLIKDNQLSIYSSLKGRLLSLPSSYLLLVEDGFDFSNPYNFSNTYGLPVKDQNGQNGLSLLMAMLKNTKEWRVIMASIDSNISQKMCPDVHKTVKQTIVFSIWMNWLYENRLSEITNTGTFSRVPMGSATSIDYLKKLVYGASITDVDSLLPNIHVLYTHAHTWATYYLMFLTEDLTKGVS